MNEKLDKQVSLSGKKRCQHIAISYQWTLIDMYIICDSTIFLNYTGAYINKYIDSKKLQSKQTYIGAKTAKGINANK